MSGIANRTGYQEHTPVGSSNPECARRAWSNALCSVDGSGDKSLGMTIHSICSLYAVVAARPITARQARSLSWPRRIRVRCLQIPAFSPRTPGQEIEGTVCCPVWRPR